MKINHLSSTEVANVSSLPIERRHSALLQIETPSVFWNYNPVTLALPKLLLASGDLFGHLPPGDDEALVNQIEKACRSGESQRNANVAVAQAIIDWRNKEKVFGRLVRHEPLRLSVDSLQYCADVVAIYNGRPWVLNLDCRSSMALSGSGKEFIKSLIFHTALIGDLREAGAAILRVPSVAKGHRTVVFEEFTGEPHYTLDELLKRISETYSIWETILRARKAAASKAGGGST